MNRGVNLQSSPVQQMMAGSPNNWWNTMRAPAPDHHHQPNFFSTTTTTTTPNSNYFLTPYPASSLPLPSWHENQDQLPESWSHLLMNGVVYEEDKASMLSQPPSNASLVDHVKQESSVNNYVYGNEEFHGTPNSTWSQIVSVPSSSSKSCSTSFTSSSMLDFSNTKMDTRSPPSDLSSDQCNSSSAGGALKKARVQPSTTQSTFKVRKEKLGDRITALHQLVSPFGKTDTASVLLESIGYIRFLHSQIEALSLPYLGNGSGNIKKQQQYVQGEKNCLFPEDPGQDCEEKEKKDLRSRGLCLVPVSCTLQVGSDNGADYWAPAFGGGFQ